MKCIRYGPTFACMRAWSFLLQNRPHSICIVSLGEHIDHMHAHLVFAIFRYVSASLNKRIYAVYWSTDHYIQGQYNFWSAWTAGIRSSLDHKCADWFDPYVSHMAWARSGSIDWSTTTSLLVAAIDRKCSLEMCAINLVRNVVKVITI